MARPSSLSCTSEPKPVCEMIQKIAATASRLVAPLHTGPPSRPCFEPTTKIDPKKRSLAGRRSGNLRRQFRCRKSSKRGDEPLRFRRPPLLLTSGFDCILLQSNAAKSKSERGARKRPLGSKILRRYTGNARKRFSVTL